MANENNSLNTARRNKKDEFYTQIVDIERELRHYRRHFKGKVVYCNCDDPYVSAFFEYFAKNFEFLQLKKLITTCYKSKRFDLFSQSDSDVAIKMEYTGGAPNNLPTRVDIGVTTLQGDGDFRSAECIELLKQSDIVVTNPPFSLFSEYVTQLTKLDKRFVIIGHQNAITYKEIFPLIQANKMWLGHGFKRNMAHFIAPHYEDTATDADHREGMIRVSGVVWYTNLDHNKRHEEIILVRHYKGNECTYPKYANYEGIEVAMTQDIPFDYAGSMGVPITFLTKHNPDQFEILGSSGTLGQPISEVAARGAYSPGGPSFYIANADGTYRRLYKRIVIRNKNPKEIHEY